MHHPAEHGQECDAGEGALAVRLPVVPSPVRQAPDHRTGEVVLALRLSE